MTVEQGTGNERIDLYPPVPSQDSISYFLILYRYVPNSQKRVLQKR